MTTIAAVKGIAEKWSPTWAFICTLKNSTTYYWSTNSFTWGGQNYSAVISNFQAIKLEGQGVYGIDSVQELQLEWINADNWMSSILVPATWQGGVIQPFFFYREPRTGTATSDSIAYPKFILDLPSDVWPIVRCTAYNKWNMARKTLPVSTISKHDRYPFPSTAAERLAAATDPTSPYYAIGYNPDSPYNHGNKTPGGGYYVGEEQGESAEEVYDGTRAHLKEIGLEIRWGGVSDLPPSDTSFVPKKGQEKAVLKGSSNPAKYGQAVPLLFGEGRVKGILLDSGGSPSGENWGGARLSHFLLCDGVNFASTDDGSGCEVETTGWRPIVYMTGGQDGKEYRFPWDPSEPWAQGGYTIYHGKYGSQKSSNPEKHRNIIEDESADADYPEPDFKGRDLYSGLCFLEVGIPKEMAMSESDNGPGVEVCLRGLKIETLDSGLDSVWTYSSNPVWIFIHLLKLMGWTWTDIDKAAARAAAVKCDAVLAGNQFRFFCNLYLDKAYKAGDILRGVRNCCRMYTSYGSDGQLELGIEDTTAEEGGSAGTIDDTVILRDDKGYVTAKKWHKSVYELGNQWTIRFQDSHNGYRDAAFTDSHLEHINQIGETIDGSSMFPVLGCPTFEQAGRLMQWMKYKTIDLNEFYSFICSYGMIDAQVGKIYTITEPRLGLSGQEARLLSKTAGPLDNSIILVFQKHGDAAYSDTSGVEPILRARSDTTWTPRSVANLSASELFIQDSENLENYQRKVRVDFAVPPVTYETFESRTIIEDVSVSTSGGTIAGNQTFYVEVCPQKSGVEGLPSEYLEVNVPAGTSTNKFTFSLTLPADADNYVIRIGTHPGLMYKHSVVAYEDSGGEPFTVTVTSISSLDDTSLSSDPFFDHVHFFYYFSGRTLELHDAGRTKDSTQDSFTFAPEVPESGDTSITIIACSANRKETDFFPMLSAPTVTIDLNLDTGNPSGASDLAILDGGDDSSIPDLSVACEFGRDTVNYKSIMGVAVVISNALPAEGPYDAERTAHPTCVIEEGTCTTVAGSKTVTVTRSPLNATLNRVLLIYTDDSNPDTDLEGEIITAQDASSFTINTPFHKSGTYAYAVIKRWWDLSAPDTTNILYLWFPMDQLGSVEQSIWRTPNIQLPAGSYYATVYSRNIFGVGTKLTSAQFTVDSPYAAPDYVLPGAPVNLTITIPAGKQAGSFIGNWEKPTTGYNTLDDVCEQFDTVSTFDSSKLTTFTFGQWLTHAEGHDPLKTYYFRVAAHNQSGVASNATVKAALEAIGRSGDYVDYGWGPFCTYVGPYTSLEGLVVNAMHGVFLETFERDPVAAGWIQYVAPAGTQSIIDGVGQVGGKAFQTTGVCAYIFPHSIPYDYSKEYRIRARIKRTAGVTPGYSYIGVMGRNAADDANTWATGSNPHYNCVVDAQPTSGVWTDYTGWFKGWAADAPYDASTDPLAPHEMDDLTRYFRPMFYLNYGGNDTVQLDYIAIDVMEEEGLKRVYTAISTLGDLNDIKAYGRSEKISVSISKLSSAGKLLTADDIDADGSIYKRITANQQTGGARGYVGLDDSGDLARDIKSTVKISGRTEGIATTVSKLTSTGKLATADDVAADGDTYVKVTTNQRIGATRAYTGLDDSGVITQSVPDSKLSVATQGILSKADDSIDSDTNFVGASIVITGDATCGDYYAGGVIPHKFAWVSGGSMYINASIYQCGGYPGATGTFVDKNDNTVHVNGGIITSLT